MKIGITLPQEEADDPESVRYRAIRKAALRAERDGFDSIWVMDHVLFEFEGQPRKGVWEAMMLMAALAEATTRVEIGALVLCTAFRNPALLAKMTEAMDEISDGRYILGLGAGWHKPEFDAFGYPFDHLASRFEDAVNIILPLIRTGEVDYVGTYEQAPNSFNRPRGPRPGGPPVLFGTQGPRLLKLAAEKGDAWNAAWVGRADELPAKLIPMHTACAEVGRDPATLELTVGQMITFPGLGAEAEYSGDIARFTFESPAELAAEWQRFAEAGAKHIIISAIPGNAECIGLITEALGIYQKGQAA